MKKLDGAIALTLVMIISIILITGGVTVLLLGIDSAYSSSRFTALNVAELYSINCSEEALYRIENDNSYVGTVNQSKDDTSCTGVTTDFSQNIKLVAISSSRGESTYSVEYLVNTETDPFTVLKQ